MPRSAVGAGASRSFMRHKGWRPTYLSGCVLWLDANDVDTFTFNGWKVAAWDDKSGNGNDATQAVAANQPDYVVIGGVNGLPGVDFVAASNEFMELSGMADTSNDWTIIAVMKQSASTGANQSIISWRDGAFLMLTGVVTGDKLGGYDGTAYRITAESLQVGDQWLGYQWDSLGPGLEVFRDGASVGSAGYDGTGKIVSVAKLGRHADIATNYLNAIISEFILYNRILSMPELSLLGGYLSLRYGL